MDVRLFAAFILHTLRGFCLPDSPWFKIGKHSGHDAVGAAFPSGPLLFHHHSPGPQAGAYDASQQIMPISRHEQADPRWVGVRGVAGGGEAEGEADTRGARSAIPPAWNQSRLQPPMSHHVPRAHGTSMEKGSFVRLTPFCCPDPLNSDTTPHGKRRYLRARTETGSLSQPQQPTDIEPCLQWVILSAALDSVPRPLLGNAHRDAPLTPLFMTRR